MGYTCDFATCASLYSSISTQDTIPVTIIASTVSVICSSYMPYIAIAASAGIATSDLI